MLNIVSRNHFCYKGEKTFARRIRSISGPAFSLTKTPKNWSAKRFIWLLEKVGPGFLLRGCPLKHVAAWLQGINNLKITASLERSETLLYLDFDCHDGKGKTEDALTLLDLVRHKLPHGEPFVTERGVGAWVRVKIRDWVGPKTWGHAPRPEEYNALIKSIQAYVRGVAAEWRLDLSSVEVHGKVIEYKTKPWVMVNRCPDLMKCPPGDKYIGEPIAWGQLRNTDWTPPVAAPKRKALLRVGSRALHRVSDEQVAGLDMLATDLVEVWFADRPTRAGNRNICRRRFTEVLLAITTSRPNRDRTMPYAMHRAAIENLHAEGKFQYGYKHEVYKAVRDYLSEKGYLPAEDGGKYTRPERSADGLIIKKGVAAKWKVQQWFRDYVNGFHVEGSVWNQSSLRSDSDTTNPKAGLGIANINTADAFKKETPLEQHTQHTHIDSQYTDFTPSDSWQPWCEWSVLHSQPPPHLVYESLREIGLAV